MLTPCGPYDFRKTLELLGTTSPFRNDVRLEDESLTRAVTVNRLPIVVRVSSRGSIEAPRLACSAYSGAPITPAIRDSTLNTVSSFLGLHDELAPFYALARSDEAFAPLVERFYGYHQLRFTTPFEAACWAILTQHNHWNIARKMKETLTRGLGSRLSVDGVEYAAFPGHAAFLEAGPDAVRWLIKNERRTLSLLAAAAAFAEADAVFLSDAPHPEVERWLRSISGIGPWSANFVLIRGLGRAEVAPLIDQPLLRAAYDVYGPHRILRTEDIAKIASVYGRYQGYWAHYLRMHSWLGRPQRRRRQPAADRQRARIWGPA